MYQYAYACHLLVVLVIVSAVAAYPWDRQGPMPAPGYGFPQPFPQGNNVIFPNRGPLLIPQGSQFRPGFEPPRPFGFDFANVYPNPNFNNNGQQYPNINNQHFGPGQVGPMPNFSGQVPNVNSFPNLPNIPNVLGQPGPKVVPDQVPWGSVDATTTTAVPTPAADPAVNATDLNSISNGPDSNSLFIKADANAL